MYFEDLYARLLELAREHVRSGRISERRLARSCDLSQPHLHNVLKNIRALSPGSADRLMRALDLTIPGLIWENPAQTEAAARPVPMLRNPVGQGAGPEPGSKSGFFPVPGTLLTGVVDALLARLSPDILLPRQLAPNDLVLLDQNPAIRANPDGNGLWLVLEKAGLRIRYLKLSGKNVFIAHEENLQDPQRWHAVSAGNILDTVRARIVWISREMETQPAGPADATGPGH